MKSLADQARQGLVAIGRALMLAAFVPAEIALLAGVLGWLLLPVFGIWLVFTVGAFPGDGMTRDIALTASAITAALTPVVMPYFLGGVRRLATGTRLLVRQWTGITIADPYRPVPGQGSRLRWLLADPATYRDLGWTLVNATAGLLILLGPGVLTALGALSLLRMLQGESGLPSSGSVGFEFAFSVALTAFGLVIAPPVLRGYGYVARLVLAQPGTAELRSRITYLAQTRTETIDASAAEIRRIERDLHDGAQARLVAIGMTLDAAGQLLSQDPESARTLLLDARDNSAKALAELRGLVRGIHPPVLADRGLADAVRALVLDSPLQVSVRSDLSGPGGPSGSSGLAWRLPPPVESAAYFAVSELLANVAKHAGARQAWIEMEHDGTMLTVTVSDDGHGGADPAAGTGLRGIQRRLAAFDGDVTITSPPGGPTAVILELPCASS
jgi:signal transduction histidine kinase